MWIQFAKGILNLDAVSYFYPFDSRGGTPRIEAGGDFHLIEQFENDEQMYQRFNELQSLLLKNKPEQTVQKSFITDDDNDGPVFTTAKDFVNNKIIEQGKCVLIYGQISALDKYDDTDFMAVRSCVDENTQSFWIPSGALIAAGPENISVDVKGLV